MQKQNMPIIFWNPFILPYPQTDLEQRHLVQMNEPVSLNNSLFFFPHAESTGWVEAEISHICFVCFEIWELKSKMFNIWWLLVFKLAQQEQHHNAKTKLENQIHQALVEFLSIYVLAAVAKSSQFKPYIDVRIMLLVGTSILISCCATVWQNCVVR